MKNFIVSVVVFLTFLAGTYPLSAARTFDRLGPYKDVTIQKITSQGIVIFIRRDNRDLSPEEIRDLENKSQQAARKRSRLAKRMAQQHQNHQKEIAEVKKLFAPVEKNAAGESDPGPAQRPEFIKR